MTLRYVGGCHHVPTPARAHQKVLFSRANLGSNFLGPLDNRPQSIGLSVNISLKSVTLEKGWGWTEALQGRRPGTLMHGAAY